MCSQHFSIKFSKGSQVLKVFPNEFVKMFPIAPQLYPLWFAQSSILMYINWKCMLNGSTFVSILQLGSKKVLLLGAWTMFQKLCWLANQHDSFTEIKRKVWVTHELINMNHTIQFPVLPKRIQSPVQFPSRNLNLFLWDIKLGTNVGVTAEKTWGRLWAFLACFLAPKLLTDAKTLTPGY